MDPSSTGSSLGAATEVVHEPFIQAGVSCRAAWMKRSNRLAGRPCGLPGACSWNGRIGDIGTPVATRAGP